MLVVVVGDVACREVSLSSLVLHFWQ